MIRKITIACFMLLVTVSIQAQSACTGNQLKAAADSYVAAQEAGDISKMALADAAKFFENMAEVGKGDGLWNTALPIAQSRSFLDTDRCKTFTEVIVTKGRHAYVLGTRLSVAGGEITEINGLVTDKGDWLFNANAYLKFSKAEHWGALSTNEQTDAQGLIDAANRYLDLFADKFIDAPWGIPCARLEGGAYTDRNNDPHATCNVGVPDGVLYIVNRSYVVDKEKGVVNVYCRFGDSKTGMPDSHTFRLVNGEYRYIHTLSVNLNPDQPSPQAEDDGSFKMGPPQ
jgi:hypothetical protein